MIIKIIVLSHRSMVHSARAAEHFKRASEIFKGMQNTKRQWTLAAQIENE